MVSVTENNSRTSWGYWSPKILNGLGVGASNGVGDNGKPNERVRLLVLAAGKSHVHDMFASRQAHDFNGLRLQGLNSLEILSYLAVAHRVCNAHPAASPPLAHPAKQTYGAAMAGLLEAGFADNILNVHLTNPGYDNEVSVALPRPTFQ